MPNDLAHIGIECGIVLVCLVALTFIVNRLGLLTWIWWLGRRKRPSRLGGKAILGDPQIVAPPC